MSKLTSLIGSMRKLTEIRLREVVADPATHEAVLSWTRAQVASGGALGGVKWAGYEGEPKYEAYKLARGAPLTPLRWTRSEERLYPALTNPSHPDHVWSSTRGGAALNITIPYLSKIEQGGRNQFGEPQPARPIFQTRSGDLSRTAAAAVKGTFMKRVRLTGLPISIRTGG